MAVVNGQTATDSTFNGAFLSRLAASTSTIAILRLLNNAVESGAPVTNVQAVLNFLLEGLGTFEGDTAFNDYVSNNYVVDGTSFKTAIAALDAQLKTTYDLAQSGAGGGIDPLSLVEINCPSGVLTVASAFEYLYDYNYNNIGTADLITLGEL